jgi:hypothetical protein
MMTWITPRTPISIAAAALFLVVFSSAVRAENYKFGGGPILAKY